MRLNIGYERDKDSLVRTIPVGHLIRRCPGGLPSLVFIQPTKSVPYLVDGIELVGEELRWTVSELDASIPGDGMAQVVFATADGSCVANGDPIEVHVCKGLPVPGEKPEIVEPWENAVARLNALYQQILQDYVSGAFKGEPGEPGKDGDPGQPGYTPVKGVDYFDGTPGAPGAPGKDGKDGSDANVTRDNISRALGMDVVQAIENTETQINELDNAKADKSAIPAPYDDTEIRSELTELASDIVQQATAIQGLETDVANAPNLFWCQYGVTPYKLVSDAVTSGKLPACMYNNNLYIYNINETVTGRIYFSQFNAYHAQNRFLYVNNKDAWGIDSNTVQLTFRKANTIVGNQSNTVLYPTTKAVADYVNALLSDGQYELIEEIVTTAGQTRITCKSEPNGTPYNFKAIRIQYEVPITQTTAGTLEITESHDVSFALVNNYKHNNYVGVGVIQAEIRHGRSYTYMWVNTEKSTAYYVSNDTRFRLNGYGYKTVAVYREFYIQDTTGFAQGTKFKIYAVRA